MEGHSFVSLGQVQGDRGGMVSFGRGQVRQQALLDGCRGAGASPAPKVLRETVRLLPCLHVWETGSCPESQ
eukprot:1915574-Amphidinium_carterae.1